jgi:DNA-binding CsgD family transcriptional regulator
LRTPFASRLSTVDHRLTPTEIRVADLVVQDKSTKEIAVLLSISAKSVSHHRASIRKKLGLAHRKINLKSYLLSYRK